MRTKTKFFKALALWAVCFFGIGQWLFGCAPTQHEVLLKMYEIEAAKQEKTAIINGYFRSIESDKVEKKLSEEKFFSELSQVVTRTGGVEGGIEERLPLPDPEGSGNDIPCSVKCLDNCDEQCRVECPDLWSEMCEDEVEAHEGELEEKLELELEQDERTPDKQKTVTALANASGDNNNQTNIVGDGNRVIIQGGSGQNSNGTNPIEQAMADILRGKVTPLKSQGEVIGEQVRGLISDTASAAVKVAPAVLTGVAINAASDAVVGISREAGDRYENSNNPDNSDNSITTTLGVTE